MSTGILTLQAGAGSFTGSRDPKLGIIAVKLKCRADTILTALDGALPDFGLTGLIETQPRTFDRDIAGDNAGFNVDVTMEGHLSPADADGEDYSMEGTTSEDPVEGNPEYESLLVVYNGKEGTDGKAKWPKTIGGGADVRDLQRNPMHGVESYLVPGLTWNRKWVSASLPGRIVRALGTIDSPPGNPPVIEGGYRNWLKIRARASRRGNVWQIEESWLLSGQGGWVPEMYRHR